MRAIKLKPHKKFVCVQSFSFHVMQEFESALLTGDCQCKQKAKTVQNSFLFTKNCPISHSMLCKDLKVFYLQEAGNGFDY